MARGKIIVSLLGVCEADKKTKEYFETLDDKKKSKILKVIERAVVDKYKECVGVPLEAFEVYDLCIDTDTDCDYVAIIYSFSTRNLSPDEAYLVQGAVKGNVYVLLNVLV